MIPGTYQEWMDCLKRFQTQPVYPEDVLCLQQGRIEAGAYLADRFQMRVAETVDIMLRRSVKRFNRLLKEAMEAGEIDSIQFLCIRLGREMERCYFYRYIRFLEQSFVDRLDRELSGQIHLFWERETKEIRRLCEENENPEVEDVYYFLRRMQKSIGK